jgi:NhaA family Na+:H+ antiporter
MNLTRTFEEFIESEKAGGFLLMGCALVSLAIANFPHGQDWLYFWHHTVAGHPVDWWVNDVLMTFFFLLVGLEIEREIYNGELSNVRNAMLPIVAAGGGMLVPALVHMVFNTGTPTAAGAGIPMATDIAFSLGILSLLGNRVPASLKVFLTALAIIDDLGAIMVIAFAYAQGFNLLWLGGVIGIFAVMMFLNRLDVRSIPVYLGLGALLWWAMHHSGIHGTLAGVLTAFAVPFRNGDGNSPSAKLEHMLEKPVAYFIIPIFALANSGMVINVDTIKHLTDANSIGIILGLVVGKPVGILLFSWQAVKLKLANLPDDLNWKMLAGAGMMAGIGFTMSIFISLLAFQGPLVDQSKLAVFFASLLSALIGYFWLFTLTKKNPANDKVQRLEESR